MKILLAWLGNTDIRASEGFIDAGDGPIANALSHHLKFDRIELISNQPPEKNEPFARWLKKKCGQKPVITSTPLRNPIDFDEIYPIAKKKLSSIFEDNKNVNLTLHLSPGTPAMSSVWILLAKTRFPAELIQTSRERGLQIVRFPFDISAEYVPDLIKRSDEHVDSLNQDIEYFGLARFQSRQMKEVADFARKTIGFTHPVLITGESGTGKEVFAKAIHDQGNRKNGPFIAVNCGAISEALIESELFGHKRGSFSGAVADRDGHFVKANNGTIFLDEIGEMPLSAQVKLLRVLQEQEVTPVGASRSQKIDVRIISATNRNLMTEVAEGRFREDLFYRLAVLVVKLPSLRERDGDLEFHIDEILKKLNESGKERKQLTKGAKARLLQHSWPGNYRELEQTLIRATVMSRGAKIADRDIDNALFIIQKKEPDILSRQLGNGFDLPELLSDVARHYLSRAMKSTNNNKSEAARLLGIPSYQTLTNWLDKYGVGPE